MTVTNDIDRSIQKKESYIKKLITLQQRKRVVENKVIKFDVDFFNVH